MRPRSEVPVPACVSITVTVTDCKAQQNIPIQTLSTLAGKKPIVVSTHTAQVVILYTKANGKYLNPSQQYRSHFLAHLRGIFPDGCIGSGSERVAMAAQQAMRESIAVLDVIRRLRGIKASSSRLRLCSCLVRGGLVSRQGC